MVCGSASKIAGLRNVDREMARAQKEASPYGGNVIDAETNHYRIGLLSEYFALHSNTDWNCSHGFSCAYEHFGRSEKHLRIFPADIIRVYRRDTDRVGLLPPFRAIATGTTS